tara:strand:- start:4701 stop:5399 length:699 start_codon:yes stop_codon:yes gene_type:complete
MIFRSIIFYILLGVWTIILGIIFIPFLFSNKKNIRTPAKIWILGIFKLLKFTCKITYEIKGKSNIPNYPCLIASKHQSAFETFALYYFIDNSIFIHKKQLFNIPIFGQYLKKANMISIERSQKVSAIRQMIKETSKRINQGFSIIIFPEGTRKRQDEPPDYKSGIVGIYKEAKAKVLPVAVNSGYCWPKHTFIKREGKIIISFLKVINSELENREVLEKIKQTIEEETKKIR